MNDFRNRLIWGDNKLVMASLLKDFRGKIDMISQASRRIRCLRIQRRSSGAAFNKYLIFVS